MFKNTGRRKISSPEVLFPIPKLLFSHFLPTALGCTFEEENKSGALFNVGWTSLIQQLPLHGWQERDLRNWARFSLLLKAACPHWLGRKAGTFSASMWVWYLGWKSCIPWGFLPGKWELLDSGLSWSREHLSRDQIFPFPVPPAHLRCQKNRPPTFCDHDFDRRGRKLNSAVYRITFGVMIILIF